MLLTGKTLVWTPADQSGGDPASTTAPEGGATGLASSDEIPAVIENWGFDLQAYDPATGMAGVMKIKGATTPPFDSHNRMDNRYLFIDYGNSGKGDTDLQMAFFLPLGTPVLSMVTGVVCDLPTLYSGDYSVRVAPVGVECTNGTSPVFFETEHVIDPVVQQGDSVVAGQRVATVSDYHQDWKSLGFGVVEIGVSFNIGNGSSGPMHGCPSRFLDPAKADGLLAVLASIHAAWEAVSGDTTLWDEAAQPILGCTTLDDIQG